MKLLLLGDKESPYLWDYYQPGRLSEYDIILSAGDLDAEYLLFIVTMARAPLLYVHGNHDAVFAVSLTAFGRLREWSRTRLHCRS